jgi:hypothetical protein
MRFSVGEIAIFAVNKCNCPRCAPLTGQECEVKVIHPRMGDFVGGRWAAVTGDYGVIFSDGTALIVADYQLRKKKPPEEPASFTCNNDIEEEQTA